MPWSSRWELVKGIIGTLAIVVGLIALTVALLIPVAVIEKHLF